MSKEMDLDGFLGHTTRGPSANFLDGWKKRSPPQVRIVLHTKAPIMAVWQHAWPKIVTREKDGKETREVWSGSFNSWETEDVLTKQYQRDDATGLRQHPPVVCPMSIMLEEVHRLLTDGQISFDTPMFRFVGDDVAKSKTLHASGMLNQAAKVWETLTEQERRDAKKRGMPGPSDAWMENMLAKCSYVFTVVDYDNLKDGIQIAKETTLVGDKMKKVIRDRMTSEGEDKGHPFLHPYVFQWTHNATAKSFADKYDVVAIGKLPISDAVRKLIVDTDAPDISRWIGKGNIGDLRASMEDAYCGPEGLLDFDFIFGKAEALDGSGASAPDAEDGEDVADVADEITGEAAADPEPEPEPVTPPAGKPAPRRTRKAATPPEDPLYVIASREVDADGDEKCFAADGAELFACDECSTTIRSDEATCRQCGMEYDVESVEAAPAKPAPAKPAPAKPAPAKPAPAPAKPAPAPAARPAAAGTGARTAAPANGASTGAQGARAPVAAKAAGKDRLGF